MSRKNQNLTPDEAAVLRAHAERHGLTASTGPYARQGSAFALQLAIITGDVALTSIDPDDRAALARWLREQTPPAHLVELVAELADDLEYGAAAAEPPRAVEPTSAGSINTLEG